MPGNEDEAAGLLDAYLARANTAARLAQVEPSQAVGTILEGDMGSRLVVRTQTEAARRSRA
jgi:hypothetical protein